jgi:cysteine desulfuration protein SufE
MSQLSLNEIIDNFELLDEWEDRYRYLIELGRELEPLPETARTDDNKVRGCVSQVWVETSIHPQAGDQPRLAFRGDSDAHIVKGLIAIVFAAFSGKNSRAILETDLQPVFERLGLASHLTPQRSNGVRAMVERIKADARAAASAGVAAGG